MVGTHAKEQCPHILPITLSTGEALQDTQQCIGTPHIGCLIAFPSRKTLEQSKIRTHDMLASHCNGTSLKSEVVAEVGVMGGIPSGGARFGAAHNADSLMPTSTMIDLIQGGGLDATVLGCAEVSPQQLSTSTHEC